MCVANPISLVRRGMRHPDVCAAGQVSCRRNPARVALCCVSGCRASRSPDCAACVAWKHLSEIACCPHARVPYCSCIGRAVRCAPRQTRFSVRNSLDKPVGQNPLMCGLSDRLLSNLCVFVRIVACFRSTCCEAYLRFLVGYILSHHVGSSIRYLANHA